MDITAPDRRMPGDIFNEDHTMLLADRVHELARLNGVTVKVFSEFSLTGPFVSLVTLPAQPPQDATEADDTNARP